MIAFSFVLLGVALILSTVRLIRGPSTADRVAALDLMAIIFAAIVAVYAVAAEQDVYYDIVLILSVFAFFGTVAIGKFIERSERGNEKV